MGNRYFFMTAEEMNDFLAYMDQPLFGCCWDVGHGHMRGNPPRDELAALGKNLTVVHIHDNDGRADQHLAPFFGTIDMDSVMRGLIDAGYFTFEADNFLPSGAIHGSGALAAVPVSVKREALRMLYAIGKGCLEAYGMFDE